MSSSHSRSASSVEGLDSKIPGAFIDRDETATTTQQTLYEALHERRSEYTRSANIRIKVGTWNVAAFKGTENDLGGWFVEGKGVDEKLSGLSIEDSQSEDLNKRESVAEQEARRSKKTTTIPKNDDGEVPGGEEIGLYALGLQEVVDISSPAEALRPYTDPGPANKFKQAVQDALPSGYQLVAEQQLIGLLLLIYASPTTMSHISSVSTTSVGTGLMGYMGNKGAVTARLILGETTRIVFINSHLAAGADKAALERRNWDASQIQSRTRFDTIKDIPGILQTSGEVLGEEDFAFWFGDLNYRLEGMPGDDVRHLLSRHTKDSENTDSSASSFVSNETSNTRFTGSSTDEGSETDVVPSDMDPASLHTTLSSLLPHDELRQQQKRRKAFHEGWMEGPLTFLPTYKYDAGRVAVFDSSDKKRCPSWCDRILYRTRRSRLAYEAKLKEEEDAKKKDEEMKARGMEEAGADEDVLFDYNPDTDGDDYDEFVETEPEPVLTKEGAFDEIHLEYYLPHQRVLSSDHKPLDAVFHLKYDAVVPELKTAIHQEIARDLDRAENEGRPSVTVVVDRSARFDDHEASSKDKLAFDGVDFGDVGYGTCKHRSITIANTGRVAAVVSFVDRPSAEGSTGGAFPAWLEVEFDREPTYTTPDHHKQYRIDPADVCNVELKVRISTMDLVRDFNEGTIYLEDVLVLRVDNGRDHFLSLRGRWLQSSFARSIDKLIRIPEGGIRKLQGQKLTDEPGVKWSAPRELFRLTEAIEDLTERTIAEWDMTSQGDEKAPWQENAGWPFVEDASHHDDDQVIDTSKAKIYDALDCDRPFDTAFGPSTPPMQRLQLLADTLSLFLRSLQDGIITEEMWEKLEKGLAAQEKSKQQLSNDDARTWFLEVLSSSPNHNISFILLTSMLSRVANECSNSFKQSKPRSSIELPASPKVQVRKRTLSQIPEVARRQLINKNYAAIFAEVIFRAPSLGKAKEKERRTREERMMSVLELFLGEGIEGLSK